MKTLLAVCFVLLCSCKSPEECDLATDTCTNYFGAWPGMPTGGSYPPKDKKGETFHAGADCTGPSYISGHGGAFPYASVSVNGECIAEDGVGYGFQVGA